MLDACFTFACPCSDKKTRQLKFLGEHMILKENVTQLFSSSKTHQLYNLQLSRSQDAKAQRLLNPQQQESCSWISNQHGSACWCYWNWQWFGDWCVPNLLDKIASDECVSSSERNQIEHAPTVHVIINVACDMAQLELVKEGVSITLRQRIPLNNRLEHILRSLNS